MHTTTRMRLRALRYLVAFTGPALAWVGLLHTGLATWALPLYGFVLLPLLELVIPADRRQLSTAEEEAAHADPVYDLLVLAMVPVQWATLVLFLFSVNAPGLAGWEVAGRIATMGLMCGVYGINVAHELGHRRSKWERDMARVLLLSSLYMHFLIEHNRGHHKRVGTPDDPASARFGEWVYAFWPRTILFSLTSAWHIEVERLRRDGRSAWSVRNELLQALVIQMALVVGIGWMFGTPVLLAFLAAAVIGILLLETVNYIEHYGLGRPLNERGTYGRVQHFHSWNSDHLLGRLMLFELTRHSDHHYMASRPYQVLRSWDDGPELPTGYPGSMVLSLIPPLWRRVMDPRVRRLVDAHPGLTFARAAASAA